MNGNDWSKRYPLIIEGTRKTPRLCILAAKILQLFFESILTTPNEQNSAPPPQSSNGAHSSHRLAPNSALNVVGGASNKDSIEHAPQLTPNESPSVPNCES
jgi:hypothetical protein